MGSYQDRRRRKRDDEFAIVEQQAELTNSNRGFTATNGGVERTLPSGEKQVIDLRAGTKTIYSTSQDEITTQVNTGEFTRMNNGREEGFSQNPDAVIKDVRPSNYGVTDVEYFSGRKERLNTGLQTVYNKDYDSQDLMFKPTIRKTIIKKGIEKGSKVYSDVTGAVNDFSTQNILNPLISLRDQDKGFRDTSKDKILYSKSLGGVGQVIKGAGDYILYKPANLAVDYYSGRMFAKALAIPLITRGSQTLGGRIIGTGLVGYTALGVAKGYKESENKEQFIGETSISFLSFGKGMMDNTKGFGLGINVNKKSGLSEGIFYSKVAEDKSFKNGFTLIADVKRNVGRGLDYFNPYAIKTKSLSPDVKGKKLKEDRGIFEQDVEIAQVPGIGEVKIKPIPSQQAGYKELKGYQGKDVNIISATTSNPYRNPWYKGFGVKKTFKVIEVPGASADRLKVGGVERGLFSSLPELKTGTTQAYSYYLGDGASFRDLSSGSAKFQLFPSNKFLLEKVKLSNYTKGLFQNIRGLNPNRLKDLNILQKWAKIENVPGTTRGGFGGVAGYRTELEAISTIDSFKTRVPLTPRGKYGALFGLGDYYIRLKSGKKVEIFNEKTEIIKESSLLKDNNMIGYIEGISPKPNLFDKLPYNKRVKAASEYSYLESIKVANEGKLIRESKYTKFKASSSKSLRYSPYKDLSLSSLGSVKSSKPISYKSPFSSKSLISSKSSISSLSKVPSYNVSSRTRSYKSPFSSRSSLSSSSSLKSSSYSGGSSKSPFSSRLTYSSIKYPKYDKPLSFKGKESNLFKSSKNKRDSFYIPSIEANIFNIKAKKSDINLDISKTGLFLRPIIK